MSTLQPGGELSVGSWAATGLARRSCACWSPAARLGEAAGVTPDEGGQRVPGRRMGCPAG